MTFRVNLDHSKHKSHCGSLSVNASGHVSARARDHVTPVIIIRPAAVNALKCCCSRNAARACSVPASQQTPLVMAAIVNINQTKFQACGQPYFDVVLRYCCEKLISAATFFFFNSLMSLVLIICRQSSLFKAFGEKINKKKSHNNLICFHHTYTEPRDLFHHGLYGVKM